MRRVKQACWPSFTQLGRKYTCPSPGSECLYFVFSGETIVRNNSVDQAVDYRDGMAKVYYVLFVIFLNFSLQLTGWVFLVVLCVNLC